VKERIKHFYRQSVSVQQSNLTTMLLNCLILPTDIKNIIAIFFIFKSRKELDVLSYKRFIDGTKLVFATAVFIAIMLFVGTKSDATLLFTNEGTTSGWDYSYSPGKNYNIQQVSYPTRSGNTAIRYEVRKSEPDPGGRYHSGLRKENMGQRGQTRWFGVSSYAVLEETHDSGFTTNQWFNKGSDCPVAMLTAQPFNNTFVYKIIYGANKANSISVDKSLSTPVPDREWGDFVVKTVFKI